MKVRYFAGLILVSLLMFGVFVNGCSQASSVNVPETLNDADTKMASGDLDGALSDYETALAADSSNSQANFGAALLGFLSVAVDPATQSLAADFGTTIPSTLNELTSATALGPASTKIMNVSALVQSTTTYAVVPSDVQTYIENTLIPALDLALGRLAVVEQDSNFQFIITSAMSGGGSDVELDLGEVYSLDLSGSLLKAFLHEAVAYDWDSTTNDPLSEINFGTLKSNGAANMASARSAYIRAMTKWTDGLNYIDAETDDQSDDAIPKFTDPTELADMLAQVGKVKDSLENGSTTIDLDSTHSIVVDLKTHFTSPIADWKVFINGANNNFPPSFDFTLNGLFPQMTTRAKWDNLASALQ